MLYRPTETAETIEPRRNIATRLWTGFLALLASLTKQGADQRYLDGMRPDELEDLGLRRTDSRDYTFFR